jgi:hypothetical protein
MARRQGENMQSECHFLSIYAKLHFTNLTENKSWVINGKGRGLNNLASEWASGQNHDRKKIKLTDLLIKNYECVTKVQQKLLNSV